MRIFNDTRCIVYKMSNCESKLQQKKEKPFMRPYTMGTRITSGDQVTNQDIGLELYRQYNLGDIRKEHDSEDPQPAKVKEDREDSQYERDLHKRELVNSILNEYEKDLPFLKADVDFKHEEVHRLLLFYQQERSKLHKLGSQLETDMVRIKSLICEYGCDQKGNLLKDYHREIIQTQKSLSVLEDKIKLIEVLEEP